MFLVSLIENALCGEGLISFSLDECLGIEAFLGETSKLEIWWFYHHFSLYFIRLYEFFSRRKIMGYSTDVIIPTIPILPDFYFSLTFYLHMWRFMQNRLDSSPTFSLSSVCFIYLLYIPYIY